MLNSKFDLYNREWLELVFAEKNKSYGAYDLRLHYGQNMAKALGITFFGCVIGIAALSFSMRSHIAPVVPKIPDDTIIEVDLSHFKPKAPKVEKQKPLPANSAPERKLPTDQYVVMKPVEGATTEPLRQDQIKNPIGSETIKGEADPGLLNVDDSGKGTGTGQGVGTDPAAVEDNTPRNTGELDVMPEPFGGAAAWSKFLQKNLRYPGMAIENGVQGRVFATFIIEKDGRISSIVIDRGPGSGLNEEAMRVLKLAPAWKPGKQNGQPVRVRYTIPIVFQLGDQ